VSPFDEWAALGNYTHGIDPCNVSRKVIVKELQKLAFGKKRNSTASIDNLDNSEHSADESAESSENASSDSASDA
jgi:hypothetical protein